MAFSFASFRAFSRALTLSAVARRRFSSFGSSQRRSALSRTSWWHWRKVTSDKYKGDCTSIFHHFMVHVMTLPACGPWWAVPSCSPGRRSSVSGPRCRVPPHSPAQHSEKSRHPHRFDVTPVLSEIMIHMKTTEVTYLLDPRGEVLNEEFAQVVKRLQLFGLREQKENHYLDWGKWTFFVVGSILGLLLNHKLRVIK